MAKKKTPKKNTHTSAPVHTITSSEPEITIRDQGNTDYSKSDDITPVVKRKVITIDQPSFDLSQFIAARINRSVVSKTTDESGKVVYTIHDVIFKFKEQAKSYQTTCIEDSYTNCIEFVNCHFVVREPNNKVSQFIKFNNFHAVLFDTCTFDNTIRLRFETGFRFIFKNISSDVWVAGAPKCSIIHISNCASPEIHIRRAGAVDLKGKTGAFKIEILDTKSVKCHNLEFTTENRFTTLEMRRIEQAITFKTCMCPECMVYIIHSILGDLSIEDTTLHSVHMHYAVIETLSTRRAIMNYCDAAYSMCRYQAGDLDSCYIPVANTTTIGIRGTDFKMYKKVYLTRFGFNCGTALLELNVPADARTHISTSGKWRVSEAKPINIIFNNFRKKWFTSLRAGFDHSFKYKLGKMMKPKKPFEEGDVSCGSGLHGYTTLEEAEKYQF